MRHGNLVVQAPALHINMPFLLSAASLPPSGREFDLNMIRKQNGDEAQGHVAGRMGFRRLFERAVRFMHSSSNEKTCGLRIHAF